MGYGGSVLKYRQQIGGGYSSLKVAFSGGKVGLKAVGRHTAVKMKPYTGKGSVIVRTVKHRLYTGRWFR
jgi:hypothetical protein